MTVKEREDKAAELFKSGYNCCQAVAMTFADVIGLPESEVARLASGFGGGMGRMREVCGTVSAMTMVAGAMIPANDVSNKTYDNMTHQFSTQVITACALEVTSYTVQASNYFSCLLLKLISKLLHIK